MSETVTTLRFTQEGRHMNHARVARPQSWWKRHGRRLVIRAIVLQTVGVAAFVFALLVGEKTHATFIALYVPRQPLFVVALVAALGAALLGERVLFAIQIGLCIVVLVPVLGFRAALPASLSHAAAERAIRLVTYNVYFGKLGRHELLDEIAAMDADIVLLQATYGSLGEQLRERLPDRTTRQDGELVIVTRFPIVNVETPEPLEGDVAAMFVGYELQTETGPLRVYGLHPFSPRHALERDTPWATDVARREAQVAAVVAASRRPGPPFVIAGDTNLPGLSSIARRQFAQLNDAFERVGWGLGYTFPAKRPWMRIDRVLAGPGVRFVDIRVGPLGASDHRPLFADFELVTSDGATEPIRR
jgi:vancomycin resistance protein VanJ